MSKFVSLITLSHKYMYREIITPSHTKLTIELPIELVGKQVEIIAFSIESEENSQGKADAFKFWEKHSIDMSSFKFDRGEANER